MCIYIYIYIHVYTQICMYISLSLYIYIYIHRESNDNNDNNNTNNITYDTIIVIGDARVVAGRWLIRPISLLTLSLLTLLDSNFPGNSLWH